MRLYSYLKIYGNYTTKCIKSLMLNNSIKVNGEVKPFSWIINDDDQVTVNNEIINKISFVYYLYNKPIGVRCDITDSKNSYINHIKIKEKVMPCGRLDVLSHGLIIFTNDGKFINEINNKNKYQKIYIVRLAKKITNDFIENITKPVIIKGKTSKPIKVEIINDDTVMLTLTSGLYHQIRRLCIKCNNSVIDLKRIQIGPFILDDLKENEIKKIKDPYDLLSNIN